MSHTLAEVYQYTSQYIRLAPLTFTTTPTGGRVGDPALSMGDWVRQTILSPPFTWRWNRADTSVPTIVGTQDYVIAIPTFGWLECATIINAGISKGLEVKLDLPEDVLTNLPVSVATQKDNGAGSITFRLLPAPDKIYTLNLTYQIAAPTFTVTSGLWTPLPDYMFHIYSQGFMAKAYEYLGDERWPLCLQMFLKSLIGFHGGLTESQISLFMESKVGHQAGVQSSGLKTQQGIMARGLQ